MRTSSPPWSSVPWSTASTSAPVGNRLEIRRVVGKPRRRRRRSDRERFEPAERARNRVRDAERQKVVLRSLAEDSQRQHQQSGHARRSGRLAAVVRSPRPEPRSAAAIARTAATKRYPWPGTVTMKRRSRMSSPSARRSLAMQCVRLFSSTATSGHSTSIRSIFREQCSRALHERQQQLEDFRRQRHRHVAVVQAAPHRVHTKRSDFVPHVRHFHKLSQISAAALRTPTGGLPIVDRQGAKGGRASWWS